MQRQNHRCIHVCRHAGRTVDNLSGVGSALWEPRRLSRPRVPRCLRGWGRERRVLSSTVAVRHPCSWSPRALSHSLTDSRSLPKKATFISITSTVSCRISYYCVPVYRPSVAESQDDHNGRLRRRARAEKERERDSYNHRTTTNQSCTFQLTTRLICGPAHGHTRRRRPWRACCGMRHPLTTATTSARQRCTWRQPAETMMPCSCCFATERTCWLRIGCVGVAALSEETAPD
jgi:hypothetical protein